MERYRGTIKTYKKLYDNSFDVNDTSKSFNKLKIFGQYSEQYLKQYYDQYLEKYYELLDVINKMQADEYSVLGSLFKQVSENNYSNLAIDILGQTDSPYMQKYYQLLEEYETAYSDLFEVMNDVMDFSEHISSTLGKQDIMHQVGIFNASGTNLFEQIFLSDEAWSKVRHNRELMKIQMSKMTTKEKLLDADGNPILKDGKEQYKTKYLLDENGRQRYALSLGTRTDLTKDNFVQSLIDAGGIQSNSSSASQFYKLIKSLQLQAAYPGSDKSSLAKQGRLNEEMMRFVLEKGGIGQALSDYNELNGTTIQLDNLAWYLTGDQNFQILLDNEMHKINISQKSASFNSRTGKISGYGFTTSQYTTLFEITKKMQNPNMLEKEYQDILTNIQYNQISNIYNLDSGQQLDFIKQAGGQAQAEQFVSFIAQLFAEVPNLEVTEGGGSLWED